MALISNNPDDYERISPPHEPDAWFKVRPVTAGDLRREAEAGPSRLDLVFGAQPHLILAWSYPTPITQESIDSLDSDTVIWLVTHIKKISFYRDDDEKKDSGSPSSPTSVREAETSPAS